jgi:hypothetical protein
MCSILLEPDLLCSPWPFFRNSRKEFLDENLTPIKFGLPVGSSIEALLMPLLLSRVSAIAAAHNINGDVVGGGVGRNSAGSVVAVVVVVVVIVVERSHTKTKPFVLVS